MVAIVAAPKLAKETKLFIPYIGKDCQYFSDRSAAGRPNYNIYLLGVTSLPEPTIFP
jgi:hypothetical protein